VRHTGIELPACPRCSRPARRQTPPEDPLPGRSLTSAPATRIAKPGVCRSGTLRPACGAPPRRTTSSCSRRPPSTPMTDLIATGDWGRQARLWDAASGTRVGPVLREPAPVHALPFSPDGRTLAVGARDGTLTLWPITAALPGDPERIRVRLEWLTGQELDETGLGHDLSPGQRGRRREQLRRLGGAPSEW
jgi:WD domain, G-beta repeat